MNEQLEALIQQQTETVNALMKRLGGIDAMLNQGQQERNALVADVIEAKGKLEGLNQAKAAMPIAKEEVHRAVRQKRISEHP